MAVFAVFFKGSISSASEFHDQSHTNHASCSGAAARPRLGTVHSYCFGVRKTRTRANGCDKTRNLRKLRIRAKLLPYSDFRRFRQAGWACFPSWTSSVRIRSPALKHKH
jgi:hypothetical protein